MAKASLLKSGTLATDERGILERGCLLRWSACTTPEGVTHVIFRDADGVSFGRLMSRETYRALPLGEAHSLCDYEDVGECLPFMADYDWYPVVQSA